MEECSPQRNSLSGARRPPEGISRESTASGELDVTSKLLQMKMEHQENQKEKGSRQSNPQTKSYASESGYSSQSQYSKWSSQPNIQSPGTELNRASWGTISNPGLNEFDTMVSPTGPPCARQNSQSEPCIPGIEGKMMSNIPPLDATLPTVTEMESQSTGLAAMWEHNIVDETVNNNNHQPRVCSSPNPCTSSPQLPREVPPPRESPVMNAYPTHSPNPRTSSPQLPREVPPPRESPVMNAYPTHSDNPCTSSPQLPREVPPPPPRDSPVMNAYPTHSDNNANVSFTTFKSRPKKLNLKKCREANEEMWTSHDHIHLSPGHVCAMDPTIQPDGETSIQLVSDSGDSSFRIVTPSVRELP